MLPIKCFVSLCTVLVVGQALLRAQYPGVVVDIGPEYICSFAQFRSETTVHGWPAFWLEDCADVSSYPATAVNHNYSILHGKLAVNAVAWAVIVVAAARLSWRTVSARGQFSLRSLFSLTFAVALLLAWWKVECAYCRIPKHPELIPSVAGPPIWRMLSFPATIGIPLIVGVGCSILWATSMASSIYKRASVLIGRVRNRTGS